MWKDHIWNPAACSCKNGKELASITENSVITCDEIIDVEAEQYDKETKATLTNFNEKNIIFETKSFSILVTFLLITKALLITVSFYFCLITNKGKQKPKTFIAILRHK